MAAHLGRKSALWLHPSSIEGHEANTEGDVLARFLTTMYCFNGSTVVKLPRSSVQFLNSSLNQRQWSCEWKVSPDAHYTVHNVTQSKAFIIPQTQTLLCFVHCQSLCYLSFPCRLYTCCSLQQFGALQVQSDLTEHLEWHFFNPMLDIAMHCQSGFNLYIFFVS